MTDSRPLILWVVDQKVLTEKKATFTQTLKGINQLALVQIMVTEQCTETSILEFLKDKTPVLILLPKACEQNWSKLKSYYIEKSASGPKFAFYFFDPLTHTESQPPAAQNQYIILDFCHLGVPEILLILKSYIRIQDRAGIGALLQPATPIYCENWYRGQGQGNRLDQVLGLPELVQHNWAQRSFAIRILLIAFWTLVYESSHGRIRTHANSESQNQFPVAYFQIGADQNSLLIRLVYSAPPLYTPATVLNEFWPNSANLMKAPQMLLKYADFLRVHYVSEKSEIEVVAALVSSAPSLKAHSEAHTLWIEPVTQNIFYEQDAPYQTPNPHDPRLRPLTTQEVSQKESSHAVKSIESIIESFQERFAEAQFNIRQYEIDIERLKAAGTDKEKLRQLKLRMEALANREKAWLKKLGRTLYAFKDAKYKKANSD